MAVKLLQPLLLDPDDVCVRFRCSRRTLRRRVNEGKLRAFEDNGRIVGIYADSVAAALEHGHFVPQRTANGR